MSALDDDALIFAFQLDGKGSAQECPEALGAASESQWFHFDLNFESAKGWLEKLALEENVIDALLSLETRPRVVGKSDGLLLILRGINTNPGADPEDMVSLRLWIENDRLISVRQRKLLSVQDVRQSFGTGHGPTSISEVVRDILVRMTERIAAFVDETENRIENLELATQHEEASEVRAQISSLRRQTAVVRRYLAPQREALESLSRLGSSFLHTEHQYAIRDLGDRLTRYVEDLDLVRERALVIESELADRVSQQLNERMYLFSIIAAIFLPITFITGIFGMNVGGMPGVDEPRAFLWALLGMFVVVLISLAILKFKKWF